jgi:hypothetical protein
MCWGDIGGGGCCDDDSVVSCDALILFVGRVFFVSNVDCITSDSLNLMLFLSRFSFRFGFVPFWTTSSN